MNVSAAPATSELLLTQAGPITYEDGRTLAAMLVTGGEDYLSAYDRSTGKLDFFGPVGNEQEWNAVPDALRSKLNSWRQMILSNESQRGVKVLSSIPFVSRLYTDQLDKSAPATRPSPVERK